MLFHSSDINKQLDKLRAQIQKELQQDSAGLVTTWSPLEETADNERGWFANFFDDPSVEVTHVLYADVPLEGLSGKTLYLALEISPSIAKGITAGVTLSLQSDILLASECSLQEQYGKFDGDAEVAASLNADKAFLKQVRKSVRGIWENGDLTLRRSNAELSVCPNGGGSWIHLLTLPRSKFFGFAYDLGIQDFIDLVSTLEGKLL